MINKNQKISKKDLDFIRSLEDFDLTMLISEVHDHGWGVAKETLKFIKMSYAVHPR